MLYKLLFHYQVMSYGSKKRRPTIKSKDITFNGLRIEIMTCYNSAISPFEQKLAFLKIFKVCSIQFNFSLIKNIRTQLLDMICKYLITFTYRRNKKPNSN